MPPPLVTASRHGATHAFACVTDERSGPQVSRVWEPGMAPADVLAKTMQPVTDVISAENRGTTVEGEDGEDGEGGPKPPPFVGKGGLPLL